MMHSLSLPACRSAPPPPPPPPQDALPTFPDAEAFALIEAELGRPLESVYSLISPQPVAAASLAQARPCAPLTSAAQRRNRRTS